MRKLVLLLGVAVLALAGAAYAASSPVMIGTTLTSGQDHATKSHGKGTFTGTITGGKLKFTLKFSDLTGAAKLLDLHPNTLRSRLKKMGISRGATTSAANEPS